MLPRLRRVGPLGAHLPRVQPPLLQLAGRGGGGGVRPRGGHASAQPHLHRGARGALHIILARSLARSRPRARTRSPARAHTDTHSTHHKPTYTHSTRHTPQTHTRGTRHTAHARHTPSTHSCPHSNFLIQVRDRKGKNSPYPSNIVFKENPGGEYRK